MKTYLKIWLLAFNFGSRVTFNTFAFFVCFFDKSHFSFQQSAKSNRINFVTLWRNGCGVIEIDKVLLAAILLEYFTNPSKINKQIKSATSEFYESQFGLTDLMVSTFRNDTFVKTTNNPYFISMTWVLFVPIEHQVHFLRYNELQIHWDCDKVTLFR